jgi:tetratricopeptide (TPR) repeat protein
MKQFIVIIFVLSNFLAFSLTPEEKSKIVEKVYNRVYSSIGTAEEKPKFLFDTKQSSLIAYMMNNKDGFPMIGFEEKAFDICATFGARRDDAIAYLIGHEISHHNLKHHWGKQFASAYSVSSLGKMIKGIDSESIVRFETQADERGGILCYLAGYNTSGISEKLLRDLYAAYGIQDGPRYPTLDERVQISKDQDSIVSTYVKVFEAGNYAMLMAEYDVAIECYEFLIGKAFHSREIYNNLGVIYFLKASEMTDESDLKFIYPVEIDLQSRINRGGTKGFGNDVKEIFEKAFDKFERASIFDKTYSTASLNMACVLSVLGRYDEAEIASLKAQKLAKDEGRTSVLNNAKLVMAIIHQLNPEGDKDKSKKILDELVALNHDFALINKAIVDGTSTEDLVFTKPLGWAGDDEASVGSTTRPTAEKIDNVRDYTTVEVNFTEEIKFSRLNTLYTGTMNESLILHVPFKSGVMVFHTTLNNYSGQMSKGLKLGTGEKQLLEAYGLPQIVMSSRQGLIYHYPKNKMMVFLDQNKGVEKWVVYSQL